MSLALAFGALAALGIVATVLQLQTVSSGEDSNAIEIAVVYSDSDDAFEFLTGVQVAIEQVNAAGGILGRPVAARLFQEEDYTDQVDLEKLVARSLQTASEIARIPSVLAVIGHASSATAVPASAVYDRHKKLFLATHATASSLSNRRLDLTFALQPNNSDNAAFLAEYARTNAIKHVVVLSDNTGYGIETTNQFRSMLTQDGGTVLHQARLSSASRSIDTLLLFLMDNDLFKPKDIDAFFITSSDAAESARFIARVRQLGLDAPILGPEYLYSSRVEELAGLKAMTDVVSVSLYDSEIVTAEGQNLRDAYYTITGFEPGVLAAIGFDAVKVLANSATRAGSLDPKAIADTLRIGRYDSPYIGATGPMVFDSKGLVTDTDAYVIRHDGTRFWTVARYSKPMPGSPQY